MLLNILINAIQVQPSGGKIEIQITRDSNNVVISIRDFGPGIAQENLDHIFDPFFTTKREGTASASPSPINWSATTAAGFEPNHHLGRVRASR